MPADTYTFTGLSRLGYMDYKDTETQEMLIADPGGSYTIASVSGTDPVPPADGRWETAAPPAAPPAPVKVALKAASSTEGGE